MTVHYYPNPLDLKYSLSLFCTCANPRMQAHLWHHKISSKMKVITFNGYLVRGTQTNPVLKKLTARGHLENYCNEGLVFIQFGLWQDLVLKIVFWIKFNSMKVNGKYRFELASTRLGIGFAMKMHYFPSRDGLPKFSGMSASHLKCGTRWKWSGIHATNVNASACAFLNRLESFFRSRLADLQTALTFRKLRV